MCGFYIYGILPSFGIITCFSNLVYNLDSARNRSLSKTTIKTTGGVKVSTIKFGNLDNGDATAIETVIKLHYKCK